VSTNTSKVEVLTRGERTAADLLKAMSKCDTMATELKGKAVPVAAQDAFLEGLDFPTEGIADTIDSQSCKDCRTHCSPTDRSS